MNWFNKLPDFQRTPYGAEWRVLRSMPQWLLISTLLPAVMSMLARHWFVEGSLANIERQLMSFDILMVALVILAWTVGLTVTIFCLIVYVMKGPAYVADAYPVTHSDLPHN